MGASEGCTLLLTNRQPHQIKHSVRHGLMIRLELACILPAKLRCCEFDGLHSESNRSSAAKRQALCDIATPRMAERHLLAWR